MTTHQSMASLKRSLEGVLTVTGADVKVLDAGRIRETLMDEWICTAVFSSDEGVRSSACWILRRVAAALGACPASIQGLYEAMGRGEVGGFTVPAINIRTLTYDTAQAVFRAAKNLDAGPILFEIARSEIDYTRQRPEEYAAAVLAAAVKVGYEGPVFLQGDHFQVNAKRYAQDPEREVQAVKDLIWEAIEAGFYNIDVDTSTLVDLTQPETLEQQRLNYTLAAELTIMIRDLEPLGVTISVGGEIGEVGGKNSTEEELAAFMEGYREALGEDGEKRAGISKISVQTGTTHGGVPLPDGTVASVKLDFETLQRLSAAARERYGLAGAVQHGASTLPEEAFDRFPACGTAEVHLATGFQNLVYDSPHFPSSLRGRIYGYLRESCASERKEMDTDEQFFYRTRKKGFGPFKADLWGLPAEVRRDIGTALEKQFSFLFETLQIAGRWGSLKGFCPVVDVPLGAPGFFK
jgi:fructose/tagatose bisphosphate aldolase